MDYKQDEIIRVIQERIKNGTYKDFLPKDITLAKELEVNPKTLGKAIRQLVAESIISKVSCIWLLSQCICFTYAWHTRLKFS